MQPTKQQMQLLDKVSTAIHEAGHLTVALALNIECEASARLVPNDHTKNWMEERYWTGTTRALFMTSVVAVAGAVADYWRDDPGVEAWQIDDYLDEALDELSPSDVAQFPSPGKRPRAVARALALLRNHKRFFEWAVVELVVCEEINEDDAAEQFLISLEVG